jgi:2-methylcitrate dehydratase PrpD
MTASENSRQKDPNPLQNNAITTLAKFASNLTDHAIPEAVKTQAGLCLLDTIGCMIAGSKTKDAACILQAEQAMDAMQNTAIAGSSARLGPMAAARVNAYMGDIFELNDLIGGHASIGNVAAALAAAQTNRASGSELMLALIAGIEITARIYHAFYSHQKDLTNCGMVSVGLASSVGSAAVAARLFGLPQDSLHNALSIAAAQAGWCPAEVIFGDGGTIKPMLFGAGPASTGLQAAHYARAGLSGPPQILDSPKGYFATMATEWDVAALTPDTWALQSPRRKLHACCGYIHSAADALAEVVKNHRITPKDIAHIKVTVPPYILPAIRKDAPPSSANEARFHIQYMLAVIAQGTDTIGPADSADYAKNLDRPELARLMSAITVTGDPDLTHYHQSRLMIVLVDGTSYEVANSSPRGTAQNPLSDAQVIDKFRNLAEPIIGKVRSDTLIGVATALEKTHDLDGFFAAFAGPH